MGKLFISGIMLAAAVAIPLDTQLKRPGNFFHFWKIRRARRLFIAGSLGGANFFRSSNRWRVKHWWFAGQTRTAADQWKYLVAGDQQVCSFVRWSRHE